MSPLHSSLVFEEEKEQSLEPKLKLVVKSRHLSVSNAELHQTVSQVVKVKGSITVSF